jgi:5-(carboxyamino)imidazole ribonucleotide synthase
MKVGIFGAGQLARMLALSAAELGIEIDLYSEEEGPCAAQVVKTYIRGKFNDEAAVRSFAANQDVCTAEFENIPTATLSWAESEAPFYPPLPAFSTAQDRLKEKLLAGKLAIPVPRYVAISSLSELKEAWAELGSGAAVLKTRSLGYDGKGQARIAKEEDLETAWRAVKEVPSLLEELFPFEREVSVIGVRSTTGEIRCYDLVENTHREGILVKSVVLNDSPLRQQAEWLLSRVVCELGYVGTVAIELFVKGETLYLNEIAPRVHNSGHWTIEGAVTSQFENHLRAILGLPLGSTRTLGKVEMENILGAAPALSEILSVADSHLHLYGKEERPGRKIGHITRISR